MKSWASRTLTNWFSISSIMVPQSEDLDRDPHQVDVHDGWFVLKFIVPTGTGSPRGIAPPRLPQIRTYASKRILRGRGRVGVGGPGSSGAGSSRRIALPRGDPARNRRTPGPPRHGWPD